VAVRVRFSWRCVAVAALLLHAGCASDDDTRGGPAMSALTPTTTGTPVGEPGVPSIVASAKPATVTTTATTTSTVPPLLTATGIASPPNGRLEITLPVDSVRGLMWFLDQREHDGSWSRAYALNTNPEGTPKRILRLGDEPYEAPDRGVSGRP
jgi:hypothetical protein